MTIPRIFAKGNVLWRISPQSSAKIWWSNSGRLLLFWKYIYKKYSHLSQNDDFWWHHFYKMKNHENRWNTVISAVFSLCTVRKNMQFGAIKNCWFGGFFWVPWKNHRYVPYFTYSQRFAWIIFRDEILHLHTLLNDGWNTTSATGFLIRW